MCDIYIYQTWGQFKSGIDYLKSGIGADKFAVGIEVSYKTNPQINLLF